MGNLNYQKQLFEARLNTSHFTSNDLGFVLVLKLTTTHTPFQSNSLWKQSVSPSSSIKETDKIKPKIAQHKNIAIFGFFSKS
jgi:hypothetical protein